MKLVRLQANSERDFERMYDLIVHNFSREHKMGSLSASEFNVEKGLRWWTINASCAAWAMEDEEGNFVASIGLHEDEPWYSTKKFLTDGWLFVRKDKRYQNMATVLIETAKEFAKERGMPLMIGIFNIEEIEGKVKAFQLMAMKLVSAIFMAGE